MFQARGSISGSTLPSGRVFSTEAGKMATWDRTFPDGWRHVAAVKNEGALRLYVDGRQVAASTAFDPGDYDLSNDRPLTIGFGAHDYVRGLRRDLRIYGRAIGGSEVEVLAGC